MAKLEDRVSALEAQNGEAESYIDRLQAHIWMGFAPPRQNENEPPARVAFLMPRRRVWQGFLIRTWRTVRTEFSSPLPVGSHKTDSFEGIEHGRQHMGGDWAGVNIGNKTLVHAIADGIIEDTGGSDRGDVLAGHSGYIVVDHGTPQDKNGSGRIRT